MVSSFCCLPGLVQENSANASAKRITTRAATTGLRAVCSGCVEKTAEATFSLVQTFSSPVWLAQQMQQRYMTEFQLEALQVDWLGTRRAHIISWLIGRLVFGLSYDPLQPHFFTRAIESKLFSLSSTCFEYMVEMPRILIGKVSMGPNRVFLSFNRWFCRSRIP